MVVFCFVNSFALKAQVQTVNTNESTKNYQCPQQQKVIFNPQTIFDERKKDTYFFHRWANWLHITTKQFTLKNESAFFLKNCIHSEDDIEELERYLRTKKYLRDAKVTVDKKSNAIKVETWDNWSLLPTISFSRKGGENSYSWGIKERNLFGLGIYTKIETYKNTQRSGYYIRASMPLFQKQNTDLFLTFADNDDGKQKSLFVKKSFAGFKIPYAYTVGFNDNLRNDTIFQNGEDQSIFSHDISYKQLSYSWLSKNNDDNNLRYRVGVIQNKELFSAVIPPVDNLPLSQLPEDRDFLYPWVGIDYTDKNYHKLTNIHLVTQIEDFNLGWQFDANIGVSNGNKADSAWLLWQANINRGFSYNDKSLILLNLHFEGETYQDKQARILTEFKGEYFHPLSEQWSFYINNLTTVSQNQYLDQPVNIGGNTGLRGFPLQYQHGKYSTQFTSEIRYYPNINILKLFDLAGTAFVDAGRAFGGSLVDNIEPDWLYSAGIGARFYSPHSSREHQMIHVDLAFPVSDNPDIDTAVIRLQVQNAF